MLFKGQNIIRDGQHRASILYQIDNDRKIPVIEIGFQKGYKRHLIKHVAISNFLKYMVFVGYEVLKRCKSISSMVLLNRQ